MIHEPQAPLDELEKETILALLSRKFTMSCPIITHLALQTGRELYHTAHLEIPEVHHLGPCGPIHPSSRIPALWILLWTGSR